MKKLLFLFSLIAVGSMTLTGCFIDVDDDDGLFGCVNGDGPAVTEELNVPDFNAIDLTMVGTVFLTQGDTQSVTVEGKPNIIDELELDVHNGEWAIEPDRCVRDVGELTFFITVPDIRRVKVSGSGEVFTDGSFDVNDVEFNISGSGKIDVEVYGDDIEANISGSGKINLTGEADELDIDISGSGDVRAFDIPIREVDISISGSGDAEVRVDELLIVRISGSGDVYYKGNPTLDISISGSGDVIDAN